MENRRIAKFFIETLIGEPIIDVAMIPQEYTLPKKNRKSGKKETVAGETKDEYRRLSVIRYDFLATVRTHEGKHKKVLIEIQKSLKPTNMERFRIYLGEQYKRLDMVDVTSGKEEKALPIICIFLLGYTIPNCNTPLVKVNRICWDMINQKEIRQKIDFIEALTHDGYFVQIPRIKGKPRNILEKLLCVFEQEFFVYKTIIKEYGYSVDHEIIREMLDVLRHIAADPEEKKTLEMEWLEDKDEEGYEKALKTIAEKEQTIAEKEQTIAEKEQTIVEKDKALDEERKKNAEKDRTIADLLSKLNRM
jgi:hypothetical protein